MDREEVINNLRACLLSAKGGVKIDALNRDYKLLINENIPFRKLGYQSLVAFLKSITGIRAVEKGGDVYVEAQARAESTHLKKLVSQQKSPSKSRKKVVNTRRPTSFREPNTTKKNVYNTRIDNFYPLNAGRVQNVMKENTDPKNGRQTAPPSLMGLSTKITVYNNETPRYIQSNSGLPPSSPSKRLKNRQTNSVLMSTNQSFNKPKDDSHLKNNDRVVTPVISQKPKTANNDTENLNRGRPSSSISERLKVNHNEPLLSNTPHSIPTSSQSEVLSPLSPAQLLADGNILQYKPRPSKSPVLTDTSRKPAPKQHPNVRDSREDLLARARALNLPEPVYTILPTKIKNAKEPAVFAQVKIGRHGYVTYPQEARTEEEAQKLAADLALRGLTEHYESSSCVTQTTNKNIIKERVMAIIDNHPSGVFMQKVPVYYKEQYKEVLPANWHKAIEESPAIVLEKGVDSIILRRFVQSKENIRDIIPKVDKIQLNPIGPPAPGQLQLPNEEFWIVTVTHVESTTEIWVRLVDDTYNEQFDIMTGEMFHHYNKIQQTIKPAAIEVDNYYVVFEDEIWHRVRCLEYNSDSGMATVSFVDHGDEDCFHYSKLQLLDKRFCCLPAQAFKVCLSGLEEFNECTSALTIIENLLLDRAFYVEVINRDVDKDGPSATVVFYDTQGPDDVNLNAVLSKELLEHVVAAPKLDVEGQISEVFLSHVDQNGDIYVQIQSESMKYLVTLLNRLIQSGMSAEQLKRSIVTVIDKRKVYFVSVNSSLYRAKVVDDSSSSQLKVFLIDFGKMIITGKNNLLSMEKLSEVLARYPPQALKVHLHNIDKSMFNEKMASKLAELAPKGEPLLVKVVVPSSNNTPVVELFKRIQPSNLLVSINNTLAFEEELKSQGDGNNNIKPRKRVERMNSKAAVNEDDDIVKSLKPPKISGVGDYFDVHVTMAAHPGHFIVQPFDDKSALERMMIQLQEVCVAYKGPHPTSQSVREGKLYAAKHIDGHWYRVCISSIIKENMVSVYFCDFGDVSVLSLNKLQPLKSKFLELPYQAIKARLGGIRPVNVDWSVEDSVRFQELVVERNFVSIVVESTPDGLSPADTILGLRLIDVDTAEDIYIDQLLVAEGRATFVDS